MRKDPLVMTATLFSWAFMVAAAGGAVAGYDIAVRKDTIDMTVSDIEFAPDNSPVLVTDKGRFIWQKNETSDPYVTPGASYRAQVGGRGLAAVGILSHPLASAVRRTGAEKVDIQRQPL